MFSRGKKMNLIYMLKRFVIFRLIWAILKHTWPILLIILFWNPIDAFLTQAIPSWLLIKTTVVVQARNIWAQLTAIPAVARIVTTVQVWLNNLATIDISALGIGV